MDNATYLPVLCKEEILWSRNLTLQTSFPDLPPCLQLTAVPWVTCGYLWLASLVYVPYLCTLRMLHTWASISRRNLTKMIMISLLVIMSIVAMGNLLQQSNSGLQPLPAAYQSVSIEIVTYILACVLTRLAFRKGQNSPGVLFIFWFLRLLAAIFAMRSDIIRIKQKGHAERPFSSAVVYIQSILVLVQFILCLWSDDAALHPSTNGRQKKGSYQSEPHKPLLSGCEKVREHPDEPVNTLKNPRAAASFLSRLLFIWFYKIVIKAYRRGLTFGDMWDLDKDDIGRMLYSRFESAWYGQNDKRVPRNNSSNYEKLNKTIHKYGGTYTRPDEVRPYCGHQSISGQRQNKLPSLALALCKIIGPYFAQHCLLMMLMLACTLAIPIVFGMLIDTITKPNSNDWLGYILAFSLYVLASINVLACAHYNIGAGVCGMRVRSLVMCAVYRKSLALSNSERKSVTSGEIVNILAVDTERLSIMFRGLTCLWPYPVFILASTYFQFQIIGPSCIPGLILLLILFPLLSIYCGKWLRHLQKRQMKLKGERIKEISQALYGIQILKLNAWEPFFEDVVSKLRIRELGELAPAAMIVGMLTCSWFVAPALAAVANFTTLFIVNPGYTLNVKTAFTVVTYLNASNFITFSVPYGVRTLTEGLVSLRRVEQFLHMNEHNTNNVEKRPGSKSAINIVKGTFTWDRSDDSTLKDIHFHVPTGSLVAVVGQVGSGKSSLLSAILGEMEVVGGSVAINGTLGYVPQQAWIQNLSLRDNILFMKALNSDKYDTIIEACALASDLQLLPAGDQTEIGERGVNLSGGQRQRVSLARAVYQNTDIYLLDDPLSAVDARVGRHIFDNIIGPAGILQNKTRLMVTHGISFLSQTDHIIVMKDGRVSEIGHYRELLMQQGEFREFINTYMADNFNTLTDDELDTINEMERLSSHLSSGSDNTLSQNLLSSDKRRRKKSKITATLLESSRAEMVKQVLKSKDRLIEEEKSVELKVGLAVLKKYFSASSLWFLSLTLAFFVFATGSATGTALWLSAWTNDAKQNATETVSSSMRVGVFGLFGALQVVFGVLLCVSFVHAAIATSKSLHKSLLHTVLRCPMSFFDTTPLGRILNRFSRDFEFIDSQIPHFLMCNMVLTASLLAQCLVVLYTIPIMIVPLFILILCFLGFQRVYIKTLRQIQRLCSVKSSPLYAFFSEILIGTSMIRAYNKQNDFIQRADRLVDHNTRTYYALLIYTRWTTGKTELLSNFFVLLVGLIAVGERDHLSPSLIAVAITCSLQVNTIVMRLLQNMGDCETAMVSVERVDEYSALPHEAPWILKNSRVPRDWPKQGNIQFQDYSVRYRSGMELVLKDITCDIPAGTKVGVVGRTGAGKSSLTLALFRIIEAASGKIIIDGVNIADMGLHDLREKLTIIPQDPEMFAGTIRFNLDPADKHCDDDIWDSLEHANLKHFVQSLPGGLSFDCGERGENFSVGQRQLVCLARALLRKTKILILDEATAAVDMETDGLIQSTIHSQFHDCTLITIAHRLNTILDYDCIMVMSNGRLVEMNSPKVLMDNTRSLFHKMAKDAEVI